MEHHQNTLPPQKTTVPGMLPAGQTPQDFDVDDDEQTLNRSSRFHTNPDEETIQGGSKKFTPKRTVVQPNRPLSYQETESVGGEWTGLPTNQDADDETTLVSTSSSRIQAVVPPQASTPETVETPSYQSLPQALPHIPEVDEKKTVPQGRDIMSGLQQNQPAPSAAQTVATPKPVMPAAEGGSIDNKTDPTGAPMEAAFNMSAPLGATTQQQTTTYSSNDSNPKEWSPRQTQDEPDAQWSPWQRSTARTSIRRSRFVLEERALAHIQTGMPHSNRTKAVRAECTTGFSRPHTRTYMACR
mgnify:CR=1 FL=1